MGLIRLGKPNTMDYILYCIVQYSSVRVNHPLSRLQNNPLCGLCQQYGYICTLLEQFWRISLCVTDDDIVQLYVT